MRKKVTFSKLFDIAVKDKKQSNSLKKNADEGKADVLEPRCCL